MSKVKGFTFFASYYEAISFLPEDDKAKFIIAICEFVFNGKEPIFENEVLKGYWKLMFPTLSKSVTRSYSGQQAEGKTKAKSNQNESKQEANESKTKANESKPETNISYDKDKDKDMDMDVDKKGSEDPMRLNRKNKIKKEFVPPTLKDVEDYIRQKGYSFSARAFIDYYEADDWHYGNGSRRVKMTNWKRACAQWGNMHKDDGDANVRDEYPRSVEELREEDWCCNFWYFMPWLDKKCPRLSAMRLGFPTSPEQYDAMVKHTEGGYKMLCYITLVLERDGWEEYNDERGFMWIYKKYIEKNGLSKASA